MQQLDILASALQLNAGLLKTALDGLSDDDLTRRPSEQCNPIGWTLWHQYRYEDGVISRITGEPEVWAADNWHDTFGLPAGDDRLGMGDSLDKVGSFRPTLENLQAYGGAVREEDAGLPAEHHAGGTGTRAGGAGGRHPHGRRFLGRPAAGPLPPQRPGVLPAGVHYGQGLVRGLTGRQTQQGPRRSAALDVEEMGSQRPQGDLNPCCRA